MTRHNMDHKAFDLDGDYYLGAEYSHNGTDPWLGTSYVVRNQVNNWLATWWHIPKDPVTGKRYPDAVPKDNLR